MTIGTPKYDLTNGKSEADVARVLPIPMWQTEETRVIFSSPGTSRKRADIAGDYHRHHVSLTHVCEYISKKQQHYLVDTAAAG